MGDKQPDPATVADGATSSVPEVVYFSLQTAIIKIDELGNSITFDVVCFFSWAPSATVKPGVGAFKRVAKDVLPWHPEVNFYNVKEKTDMEMSYFVDMASGCHACLMNWVVECYEVLELYQFPFDRQLVKVLFNMNGVRLAPARSVSDGGVPTPKSFPSHDDQLECIADLGNWHLDNANLKLELMNAGPDMVDSEVRCEIELTRVPMYYLWNIVLVVFVLVLASFCVVGVPFEDLADRMSITMTLMLTVVAFKFVIAGMVPPTPYLTFMDKYVLSAFVLIGMIVVENFLVSFAENRDTARILDYGFSFVLAVLWLSFHLFMIVGTRCSWFYISWDKVRERDDESAALNTIGKGYKAVTLEDKFENDKTEDEVGADGEKGVGIELLFLNPACGST